jgi:integrase
VDITHTIVRVKGEGLVRKVTKSRAGERALSLPKFAVSMLRARCAAGIRLGEPVFADSNRGFRDPSNVRRDLREARSPSGNAARRDLGLSLRAVRRGAGMSRKDAATSLGWPQNRVALVEAGRVKVDRLLATEMLRVYEPSVSAKLLELVAEAGESTESDVLAWITSHSFRKTTATVLDDDGQSGRQIADQLGHSRPSMTQDIYMGRKARNPGAAEALDRAFEDPDLD